MIYYPIDYLYIYIYIYIYIKFTEALHHNTLNMTQNRWIFRQEGRVWNALFVRS